MISQFRVSLRDPEMESRDSFRVSRISRAAPNPRSCAAVETLHVFTSFHRHQLETGGFPQEQYSRKFSDKQGTAGTTYDPLR